MESLRSTPSPPPSVLADVDEETFEKLTEEEIRDAKPTPAEGDPAGADLAASTVVVPPTKTDWRDRLALFGGVSAFTMAGHAVHTLEKLTFAACFFGPGVYAAFGVGFCFLIRSGDSQALEQLTGQVVQLQKQLLVKEVENRRQAEALGAAIAQREAAILQAEELEGRIADKDIEIQRLRDSLKTFGEYIEKLKGEAEEIQRVHKDAIAELNKQIWELTGKLEHKKGESRDNEQHLMIERTALDYDILYNQIVTFKNLLVGKGGEWGDYAKLMVPAEQEIERLKKEAEDKIKLIFRDPCALRTLEDKKQERGLAVLLNEAYKEIHAKMYPPEEPVIVGEAEKDDEETEVKSDFSVEEGKFFLDICYQWQNIISCAELIQQTNAAWLQTTAETLGLREFIARGDDLINAIPQIPGVT